MRVCYTHRFNSLCGTIYVVIVILNVYFCCSITEFTQFSTRRWNRKSFRFRFQLKYTTNIHICGEFLSPLLLATLSPFLSCMKFPYETWLFFKFTTKEVLMNTKACVSFAEKWGKRIHRMKWLLSKESNKKNVWRKWYWRKMNVTMCLFWQFHKQPKVRVQRGNEKWWKTVNESGAWSERIFPWFVVWVSWIY